MVLRILSYTGNRLQRAQRTREADNRPVQPGKAEMTQWRVILATFRRWRQWYGGCTVDDTRSNKLRREMGKKAISDFIIVLLLSHYSHLGEEAHGVDGKDSHAQGHDHTLDRRGSLDKTIVEGGRGGSEEHTKTRSILSLLRGAAVEAMT